jgi:hypothetical protein
MVMVSFRDKMCNGGKERKEKIVSVMPKERNYGGYS